MNTYWSQNIWTVVNIQAWYDIYTIFVDRISLD